jgi:hypothetical protein
MPAACFATSNLPGCAATAKVATSDETQPATGYDEMLKALGVKL